MLTNVYHGTAPHSLAGSAAAPQSAFGLKKIAQFRLTRFADPFCRAGDFTVSTR
jgi:hypothetical protein